MTSRLDSARLKLDRALEHHRSLQEEVAAYWARKPYGLGPEKHAGDGVFIVRFLVRRNPPIRLAILAGDAVTTANDALDHLVYGLSRTKPDGTGFPIYWEPDKYVRNREGLLAGVREFPERALIDAYQPYNHRERADPLWLLREFANADKHRITQPGFARPRHLRIKAPSGYVVSVRPVQVTGRIKNGAVLAEYQVIGPPSPQGSVPVQARVELSIGFGPMAIDLVEIEEALARVDEIIRAF